MGGAAVLSERSAPLIVDSGSQPVHHLARLPLGSKGHEIVAAVAETQLTETARKRIKELLPQGTTLADASTCPDKAGRQIPDMDPYHFVNFPKDANRYDEQRDCKLRNCVIEAIAWYMQVLKSPDAPRNEKRIALRFIAHLVGDIHQPLHAGFQRIVEAIVLTCASTAGKKPCTRCGTPRWLGARNCRRDRGDDTAWSVALTSQRIPSHCKPAIMTLNYPDAS